MENDNVFMDLDGMPKSANEKLTKDLLDEYSDVVKNARSDEAAVVIIVRDGRVKTKIAGTDYLIIKALNTVLLQMMLRIKETAPYVAGILIDEIISKLQRIK